MATIKKAAYAISIETHKNGDLLKWSVDLRPDVSDYTVWRSWGVSLEYRKDDLLLGMSVDGQVSASKFDALMGQLGQDGVLLMQLVPRSLVLK